MRGQSKYPRRSVLEPPAEKLPSVLEQSDGHTEKEDVSVSHSSYHGSLTLSMKQIALRAASSSQASIPNFCERCEFLPHYLASLPDNVSFCWGRERNETFLKSEERKGKVSPLFMALIGCYKARKIMAFYLTIAPAIKSNHS